MQFSPTTQKFQAAAAPLARLLVNVATQAELAVRTGPHLTAKQRATLEHVAAAAQQARQRLEAGR